MRIKHVVVVKEEKVFSTSRQHADIALVVAITASGPRQQKRSLLRAPQAKKENPKSIEEPVSYNNLMPSVRCLPAKGSYGLVQCIKVSKRWSNNADQPFVLIAFRLELEAQQNRSVDSNEKQISPCARIAT